MSDTQFVEETITFVKEQLNGAEGGHDWFHIQRVFKNSVRIARGEQVDVLVVSLGALLHDIADAKFHDGDETIGPKMAKAFLKSIAVPKKTIDHVVKIIQHISFKNSLEKSGNTRRFNSKELQVVQDADRLDAMGLLASLGPSIMEGIRTGPFTTPIFRQIWIWTRRPIKNPPRPP